MAHEGDPTANDGQPAVSVTVRDGLASVEACDAALADILKAVAEQAGFELSIKGDVERNVTRHFRDIPVDEAVRKILQFVSSVVTYGPPRSAAAGPAAAA